MRPDGDRPVHSRMLADRVLAALSRPELRNVLSLKIEMQPDSAAVVQVEMLVSERVAAELETALVQFDLVPKSSAPTMEGVCSQDAARERELEAIFAQVRADMDRLGLNLPPKGPSPSWRQRFLAAASRWWKCWPGRGRSIAPSPAPQSSRPISDRGAEG